MVWDLAPGLFAGVESQVLRSLACSSIQRALDLQTATENWLSHRTARVGGLGPDLSSTLEPGSVAVADSGPEAIDEQHRWLHPVCRTVAASSESTEDRVDLSLTLLEVLAYEQSCVDRRVAWMVSVQLAHR